MTRDEAKLLVAKLGADTLEAIAVLVETADIHGSFEDVDAQQTLDCLAEEIRAPPSHTVVSDRSVTSPGTKFDSMP